MAAAVTLMRRARSVLTLTRRTGRTLTVKASGCTPGGFEFTPEKFSKPQLPEGLTIMDVPLLEATDENLKGLGKVLHSADECTVEKGTFEICTWPQPGWRKLDPNTGDEAGTTEGDFDVCESDPPGPCLVLRNLR
jgi:hypothetical protein